MALEAFTATVGTVAPTLGRAADPSAAVTALASAITTAKADSTAAVAATPVPTAFEAALATLVADGASPTQAHVTAVNDAYTTLAAAQATFVTAVGTSDTAVQALSTTALAATLAANITVLFNASAVSTKNKLVAAINALLSNILGQGILT